MIKNLAGALLPREREEKEKRKPEANFSIL